MRSTTVPSPTGLLDLFADVTGDHQPPGVPVRGSATLVGAKPVEGGVQAKAAVTVEFAGTGQTCCVAAVLFRYYT